MAELRGFIFAVTFVILFSGLVVSVPSDLYGAGDVADIPTPVDPVIVGGFNETETWNKTDMSAVVVGLSYEYNLNSKDWICTKYTIGDSGFELGSKALWFGLWFGALDYVYFVDANGTDEGQTVTLDDIEEDAEEGTARYDMYYYVNGNHAGSMLFSWNTTLYSDPSNAWGNSTLYVLHGTGFGNNAPMDITTLVLSFLSLQLPDCPVLINLILVTPVWACLAYIIWWIIISMIPFLGGA